MLHMKRVDKELNKNGKFAASKYKEKTMSKGAQAYSGIGRSIGIRDY